uniref:Uncharacterized protein n=1 Tax=Zea mays TaxID=4577 RepID=B6SN73_MAIZE|nr:hypothetical protein [Zea mays]ACR37336.1 unknown [Zea mays]
MSPGARGVLRQRGKAGLRQQAMVADAVPRVVWMLEARPAGERDATLTASVLCPKFVSPHVCLRSFSYNSSGS